MSIQRGDIALAWFPFASGAGGKRRPCVVFQNDSDNQKLSNTNIAQITSNLARQADKSHVPIEISTSEGAQTGLRRKPIRLILAGQLPASRLNRLNPLPTLFLYLPVTTVMWQRAAAFWGAIDFHRGRDASSLIAFGLMHHVMFEDRLNFAPCLNLKALFLCGALYQPFC